MFFTTKKCEKNCKDLSGSFKRYNFCLQVVCIRNVSEKIAFMFLLSNASYFLFNTFFFYHFNVFDWFLSFDTLCLDIPRKNSCRYFKCCNDIWFAVPSVLKYFEDKQLASPCNAPPDYLGDF